MFFLQAAQVPLKIKTADGFVLVVPLLTMDDVIQLGTEIRDQRANLATAHLNETQKAEFLTFYPPLPPAMSDIKKIILSPEGSKRVVQLCFAKAKFEISNEPLPENQATILIASQGAGVLAALAFHLADMIDKQLYVDPNPKGPPPPLASSGKDKPKTRSMIGAKTSD